MQGHHFDTETWKVTALKTVIAGANFDPSSLM